MSELKNTVEAIIRDGVIDKEEYAQLMKTFHDDGVIDAEEKEMIDKVYQLIKDGKVTVAN